MKGRRRKLSATFAVAGLCFFGFLRSSAEGQRGHMGSFNDLYPGTPDLSGVARGDPLLQRIAQEGAKSFGRKMVSDEVSDGLKCAAQASETLKRAGVEIRGSLGVVDLVNQLKRQGWTDCPGPVPGTLAYANPEYGNGPRSHAGIVGWPVPERKESVDRVMRDAGLDRKYKAWGDTITIFHNEINTVIDSPRKNIDVAWFNKARFLGPSWVCGRR